MQNSQDKRQLFLELRSVYLTYTSPKQKEALKTNLHLQGAGETIEQFLELLDFKSFEDFDDFINKKIQRIKTKEKNKETQECPLCLGEGYTYHKTYGSKQKCSVCKGKKVVTVSRLKSLELI